MEDSGGSLLIKTRQTSSFSGLPERNEGQSTFLRVKEEIETAAKKLIERKLKVKLLTVGDHVKQGTPIFDISMKESHEHLDPHKNLDNIYPSVGWEHKGKTYGQKISDACTTSADVVSLKEKLDQKSKKFGIEELSLSKRHELYTQCFDEIIRQVSISCAERGKLLLAIRDELNLTFSAYESLFSSAVAFGIRKQLRHEQNVENWQAKIRTISQEIANISSIHKEFEPTFSHLENKFTTQMETDQQEYDAEYERLVKNNRVLKNLLLTSVRSDKEKVSEIITMSIE